MDIIKLQGFKPSLESLKASLDDTVPNLSYNAICEYFANECKEIAYQMARDCNQYERPAIYLKSVLETLERDILDEYL